MIISTLQVRPLYIHISLYHSSKSITKSSDDAMMRINTKHNNKQHVAYIKFSTCTDIWGEKINIWQQL